MRNLFLNNLLEVSAWNAANRTNQTALIYEDRSTTYGEFDKYSSQVAAGLDSLNVKAGSRVAILSKDIDYGYEILFGCAKSGAVLISMNWRLSARELKYILEDGDAELLFVQQEFVDLIKEILPELPLVRNIITIEGDGSKYPDYQSWRDGFSALNPPSFTPGEEDAVLQLYTSGTTGKPKGVQLAHYTFFRLLHHMYNAGDKWMDLNDQDVLLVSLPMFHIGGLWWAVQGFISGSTNVLIDVFIAWKVLQLIEKHKITKIELVPAMLGFCLSEPAFQTTDFSSVKAILYGGSPISDVLMSKAAGKFGCDFFQIYGMTETGNMAVCLRPEDHHVNGVKRLNAAGRPLPGVEVKIIDPSGRQLKATEVGEIYIKSPSVMLAYWKNQEETDGTLVDGWIRTGDGGYQDQDGYLYVCDRIKDMIICAGENIFPAEIEAVLCEHEDVAEAAVIGIPDDLLGESVKAFVVLKPGAVLKSRALIGFVRARLANFKGPNSVSFIEELPRNPSGKILKRVLREPYWTGRKRAVN
ncbi:AMP-dependent synthetase [Pedobacter lusitanus]|uniref:AMP-dependent synthetase n=1 Tax=Pedobacter lusitanus TaxID=1503925 RepID=A0A0D0GP20_9SPHI|nr:long-chain-fatty-acid--CoA ligase [Pedobacter lusitanus]KIO77865.1 AMP-dependent synthetase [Pedobacter lusitanus]